MRCIFCGWTWFRVSVSWVFTFAGLGFKVIVSLWLIVLVSVFGVRGVGCGFWFYVGCVCLFAGRFDGFGVAAGMILVWIGC